MITDAQGKDTAMSEIWNALTDPSIPFFRYAFIAGILSSVALGIIGTYVVTRRISYIAGAISHCVLAGIGLALYLKTVVGLTLLTPMHGAILSAVAAALIIGCVSMYASEREDTVIGALWAAGMSLGLIFIAMTPGYTDAMSYLFGNILLVSGKDLVTVLVLDAIVTVTCILFYNKFLALCFDEKFARLRGINVNFYYLLLLTLTALTTVLLLNILGTVMVIAMLTIPSAIAGKFSKRMWHMMIISMILNMLFTAAGLILSYHMNLPSGPVIILIAGAAYIIISLKSLFKTLFPKN